MIVYIQGMNGLPIDDWTMTAYLGFKKKNAKVKIYENIEEVPLNRNSMVVGSIEDTQWFFKKMGIKVSYKMTIPHELWKTKYLKRIVTGVYDLKQVEGISYPYFVKPQKLKEFDVFKVSDELERIKYEHHHNCIVSEYVNFKAEYRCFINHYKIIGCQHYSGDIKLYPNLKLVEDMISDWDIGQPVSFTIDVGILDNDETCLIECNDGWSSDSYGLDSRLYSRWLMDRWLQILYSNPVEVNEE